MKNRILRLGLALALGALPFGGACVRASSNAAAPPVVSVVQPPATTQTADAPAAPTVSTNAPAAASAPVAANLSAVTNTPVVEAEALPPEVTNDLALANAPVKVVSAETPVPADLGLSAAALELVKLAHSNVDEDVMLAYANNSASTFNLTADQIIYLNDIGVPSKVVTAMIERDIALKGSLAAAAVAPQPAAPDTNAPPPPEQVAPQAEAPAAAPPQTNVTYATFYEGLAPYGTWIELEGYGRVWQPTVVVVNPGWRPYFDGGRWIYTDSGWYWYSDYTWGWAPFHYGRWFRHHRIGWCWWPDVVWGPAWVTWRYTDAYCGWAPLPPWAHYRPGFGFTYYGRPVGASFGFGLGPDWFCFVSYSHLREHRWHHHALPPHHVPHVYHGSRISHVHPPSQLATHLGVKTAIALNKTPVPPPQGSRPERLASNGKSLTVYRPELASSSSLANRLTQRTSSMAAPRAAATVTPATLSKISGQPATLRRAPAVAPRTPATPPQGAPAAGSSTLANRLSQRPARGAVSGAPAAAPAVPSVQASPGSSPNRLTSRPATSVSTTPAAPAAPAAPATRSQPLILRGSQSTPASPSASPRPATPTVSAPRTPPVPSAPPATAQPGPSRPPERGASGLMQRSPTMAPSVGSGASSGLQNRLSGAASAPAQRSFSAPAYQAPAPAVRSQPAYTPPAVSVPRPSAPVSAPARPYTPAPSMRAPAPMPSAPAISAPPRSAAPSSPAPAPAPSSSGSRLTERGSGMRGR